MQNVQQPRPICGAFRSLALGLKKPKLSRRNSKSKWLWRKQSGRTSSKNFVRGPPARASRSRPPQVPPQAAPQPARRNAGRREKNKRGPTGFRSRGACTKSCAGHIFNCYTARASCAAGAWLDSLVGIKSLRLPDRK